MAMDLSLKKCKPCEGGVKPLNQKDVKELQKQISDKWKVMENAKLTREFSFVNYAHTMEFVNKVADLAESEGHHPVMHVFYGRIIIELWTHSINGLSENDFILASKIEKI
jgi:4a-hydroxytetrahydrobiopterin dehydratase